MSNNTKNIIPDDPTAQWVVSRFEESKTYYKPLYEKFSDWDDQYFSIPDDKKYDWQSNIFVPATYKAIKTLLARIMGALFSTNPPFDVVGVEEKDKPGEKPIKNLINYQFDKTKIFDKFVLLVLQALIRGTSVGKVVWRKDVTYVPRTIEYQEEVLITVDEQGKPLGEAKKSYENKTKMVYDEKIIYEGPDFEVIDIHGGLFPDPYATSMNDGYIIHRVVRTEDYLRKNKDKYDNINLALMTEYPGNDFESWNHSRLENIGITQPNEMPTTSEEAEDETDEKLKKYEILECHCKYDINGDGYLEDSIITVCNRQVVIKKRVNQYPDGCFVKIGFMPVLNEFFGQGVCELVEPLQKELNDKRNQRLDNVNLCLQQILVFVEGAVDTQVMQNFVFAPGKKLPVKDINAVQFPKVPDVTASSYNEEQILVRDIQETSDAVSVLQASAGGNQDIHRTASGLFMLKGEAETTIKLVVQMMENMGLSEIAKKYDSLNKMFMTQPLTVRILGEQGYQYPTISPEDVKYYNCDFVFKGASAYVNREIRLAQLTKFMDIVGKVPQLAMQFDPQKLCKMVANTLGFDENELLRTQVNPILAGAGLNPNQQFGGNPGNVGYNPGGNDALNGMVNEGLPLATISGLMEKMQSQGA